MPTSELFVIGITHRTAPLGVRERLALTSDREAAFAADLGEIPGLAEFVVLNTCNRIEVYGVARHRTTVEAVAHAFCRRQNVAIAEFEHVRFEHRNVDAIQHLFRVAAGLDSQMLGETEIFGQVKKAYATAQERGTAGAVLNRTFQKTFQAVKTARTETGITEGLVSVANVAVNLATTIFGPNARANTLLLGAGEIGRKCGRAFLSRGADTLTVASRRLEHAAEVATEIGGQVLAFEECTARLADFDVVVCATSAPEPIITVAAVKSAMRARQGRPLFLIDTALPRNVEPVVAQIENVFVYDLDDLATVAAENRAAREAEIERCQELLGERALRLWANLERQLLATETLAAAATPARAFAFPAVVG
jgi:glutamyl-tRNA reductase